MFRKKFGKKKYGKKKYVRKFKKSFKRRPRQIVKTIKRVMQTQLEKKVCYLPGTNVATVNIGSIVGSWKPLIHDFWPAQGTSLTTRIGDKIFIRYIYLNCSCQETYTAYWTSPFRQVIVKSKPDLVQNDEYYDTQACSAGNSMIAIPKPNMPPIFMSKILKPYKNDAASNCPTRYQITDNSGRWTYWRTKIRVMKEYSKNQLDDFNHAEFNLQYMQCNSVDNAVKVGNPTIYVIGKMTFTDA